MAMNLVQVRLPEGLLKKIDESVEAGYFASKSDLIRHAVRKMLMEKALHFQNQEHVHDEVKKIIDREKVNYIH